MGEIKVFVGNVNFNATEDELQDFFSDCKGINEVAVIMDRNTGRSKGYAFIMFKTDDDAQYAIENKEGQDFQGRQLKVKLANNQENNRSFKDNRLSERNQRFDRGGHSGGYGDVGQVRYNHHQGYDYGHMYTGPNHTSYSNGYGSYSGGSYGGGGGYGSGDYGGGYLEQRREKPYGGNYYGGGGYKHY